MCKHQPMQILTKKMPEQNVHAEVNCVNTSVCAMEMIVRSGMSLKPRLTSALKLVPGNPLLTDHQHNLRLRCLKWVNQLWSRVKHVLFVLFIIMFILYVE